MKLSRKFIAFPGMLLLLVFAFQASAETLGVTLADQLCYKANPSSYTLSVTEFGQWSGQEVRGEKAEYKGSDKYIATFYKSRTKDDNATCKQTFIVSGKATCKQAGVTKSANVLTRAAWTTVTCQ